MKNYNKGEKVSIKRCYEVHINGYITDVCPGEVGTVHWDCGDTVEVYFGDYIMLEVNKEDIEPCISEEAEEVTIDGWVARNKEDVMGESELYLYPVKPFRKNIGSHCPKMQSAKLLCDWMWDYFQISHLKTPQWK